jgi:hypothetical protein
MDWSPSITNLLNRIANLKSTDFTRILWVPYTQIYNRRLLLIANIRLTSPKQKREANRTHCTQDIPW